MNIRGMAGLAALKIAYLLPMVAFLSGSALCEEAKHPEKPLLWKIEGNGLAKPSYLFGTIHIGTKQVVTLHPAAQKAFDSAGVVYTEVSMDPKARKDVLPLVRRKDGKTLSESIGKELSQRLTEELKHVNLALKAEGLDPLVTWMAAILLHTLPDLLKGDPALDEVLWNKAVEGGKQTGALETVASNAAMFEKMGEAAQVAMLAGTLDVLKECREKGEDAVGKITADYMAGDLETILAEADKFFVIIEREENGAFGKLVSST
jgi:hypothetical protein